MTRTEWRDGERTRLVDVAPLGNGRYRVSVDGVPVEVAAQALGDGRLKLSTPGGSLVAEVTPAGRRRFVRLGTLEFVLDLEPGGRARGGREPESAAAGRGLEAPMPGVVTRVMVSAGDAVESGQALLAIEAMKMEHLIRAPRRGVVRVVRARAGDMVAGGAAVIELEPGESPA
jgi:3-methylcrotonyl-CoA carboxylase alpha subunit